MKRGNKSGQFYLISAIALAAILVGIVSVTNYIGKDSNVRIYDLGEELKIESRSFVEYGMSQSLTDPNFHILFQDFVDDYVSHKSSEIDIYLMFGTASDLTVAGSQGTAKEIIFQGATNTTITETAGDFSDNLNPGTGSVMLWIGNSPQTFELTSEKNIYFVLYEELNSNEYIVKW